MSPWDISDLIEEIESLITRTANEGLEKVARTLEKALEQLDKEIGKMNHSIDDISNEDYYGD